MATFEYTALDVTGRTRKGVLSADTARGARKELKQRRLTPLKLAEVSEKRAAAAESRFSFLRRTSIGGRDLALVTRQLATLIRGGAPVEEAVRAVAAQADKPAVRRTLLSVRNGVMEGRRLSEAMAEDDASFSKLYRAMVAAGEASGGLGPVLERLSDFLEKMQAMQRKIMGAMIYPIVLSFTAIAMVTALMVFVVPKLVEQFASIGQELPPLTRALIATSEFLGSYGIFVLVGLFVGLFAFLRALKNEGFRRRVDAGLLRLPLIGRLIREVSAARFARTMATLTASGSPVLQSLQAARDTVNNLIFRDAIHSLVVSVREGASLNGAMRHTNMFPPLVVYMAASGENSGELPDMLGKAADYLEAEFEAVTGVALNLLEPAIIILMGGIVMTIILAILLPILNLNTLALV